MEAESQAMSNATCRMHLEIAEAMGTGDYFEGDGDQ
jgi:hypothetical protein